METKDGWRWVQQRQAEKSRGAKKWGGPGHLPDSHLPVSPSGITGLSLTALPFIYTPPRPHPALSLHFLSYGSSSLKVCVQWEAKWRAGLKPLLCSIIAGSGRKGEEGRRAGSVQGGGGAQRLEAHLWRPLPLCGHKARRGWATREAWGKGVTPLSPPQQHPAMFRSNHHLRYIRFP